MPRGRQTDPEAVEAVLAVYARTANIRETARQTGVPGSTIAMAMQEYQAPKHQVFDAEGGPHLPWSPGAKESTA